MSEIEESAKAIQETAKVISNALDKSEKFGNFFTKYFSTTLEESIGIFNDKLKYRRFKNQIYLIKKIEKNIQNLDFKGKLKKIPLKYGIPMLEIAYLEEDNYLLDLWSNLIVNSSTDSNFNIERSYINVLEQLSPLEAKILLKIYRKNSYSSGNTYRIDVSDVLNKITIIKNESLIDSQEEANEVWNNIGTVTTSEDEYTGIDKDAQHITSDIKLALSNLIRLRCIIPVSLFGGGEVLSSIHPTLFGAKLYEAVKEPVKNSAQ